MNFLRNKKGYTLTEVMIVVAIIGVLAALSVPSYNKFTAHQNLNGAARELFSDIRGTRVTAIREGVQYGIYFPNNTSFQVIKVANAPTYTSFAQAETVGLLNPPNTWTVVSTYDFKGLSYYGVNITVPANLPIFQRTGAVSSWNPGANTFSSAAPGIFSLTNSYGETKTVSINTAGYAQIH